MNLLSQGADMLVRLGYTPEEASFIHLVAVHSGYFTHKQFLRFAETKPGKHSQKFLEKLLAKEHASSHTYQSGARVYHIFSRKVFRAIGWENLRTRRRHQLDYIKTRLMALDFVLSNPHHHYLETEAEKVPFFERRFGISRVSLPSRTYVSKLSAKTTTRYFVDRFPLYVKDVASSDLIATFTYLDPGSVTLQGFTTHLRAYAGLFQSLRQFNLIYVAPCERSFRAAQLEFSRSAAGGAIHATKEQIARYFRLRQMWEEGRRVEAADVVFLNDARRQFRGEGIESLYRQWCAGSTVETDFTPFVHADRTEVQGRISMLVCSESQSVFECPHEGASTDTCEKVGTSFSPRFSPEISPS
jgi:hypothetical protein